MDTRHMVKGRERELLKAMFDAAIAAAQPDKCIPPHLPAPPLEGFEQESS